MSIDIQVSSSSKKTIFIRQVIEYMMKALNLKNIFIDVEISNLFKNENAFGFCLSHSPTEFLIELDHQLESFELIETICHEMIHVKQYATGELVEKGEQILYRNRLYDHDSTDDSSPWEKEAYEKELYYVDAFMCEHSSM